MKTRITLLLLTICLSLGSASAQVADQGKDFEKLWMASMTPGVEHAFLKKMEGKWSYEMTSSMGGAPEVSKGKSTKKMILGGRYLDENANGNMMGMPFLGRNTFAYDNMLKKYRSVWIDNMGTGFMIGEGVREGDEITIYATYPDLMGGPDTKYKLVYKVYSDKKHRYEMYMVSPDGQVVKQMTIVYSR
jgi:hypothetical protein